MRPGNLGPSPADIVRTEYAWMPSHRNNLRYCHTFRFNV